MERKVSVIVPVYNVEKYLEKCVKSILDQDYTQLEIILVDDGSTDKCGEICDRLANLDARIKVIHKKNGGLSEARNYGIDMATGDYLVFIDSDDFIHKSYISVLLQTVLCTKADMAICNFTQVKEDQVIEDQEIVFDKYNVHVYRGTEKFDRLYSDNLRTVVAWNKIYARHLFAQLRYPHGKLQEDEFVIHRLLYMADQVAYIDSALYFYVQRSSSIMSIISLKNIHDGYDALLEREKFFLSKGLTKAYIQNLGNQLFYATHYYDYIKVKYHDKPLLHLFKQNIGKRIHNKDLKSVLGQRYYAEFALFQKCPRLYYYMKQGEETVSFSRKILEKLINVIFR